LQALREAGTEATLSTVEGMREETFLVLEVVLWEVAGAFVDMGVPFAVVDTFFDEEKTFLLVEDALLEEEVIFLLVEVAFFVVTATFFVEVDGLTVEVILTVEVTRLTVEEEEEGEEAGRNIWAIRLSKFTRGCNESRERR
jgi:hypothetical protein